MDPSMDAATRALPPSAASTDPGAAVTFPFGPALTLCCPDAIHRDHGRGNRDIQRFVRGRGQRGAENPPEGQERIDLSVPSILATDQRAPLLLRHARLRYDAER